MNTRVKICGITRVQDGLAAVRLGAHAIGLVFYDASPRAVTTEQARLIVDALPPFEYVVPASEAFVAGAAVEVMNDEDGLRGAWFGGWCAQANKQLINVFD